MAGTSDDEEIELDIDQLPNATLMRLHAYVRSLSRRAAPQAGAPNKAPISVCCGAICVYTCQRVFGICS